MIFNIFTLPGPTFLFVYLVLGLIVLLLTRHLFKTEESHHRAPKLNLTDPYEIAYLRGGKNETIRIAIFSLVDRGLLQASDLMVEAAGTNVVDYARRPLEKAILNLSISPKKVSDFFDNTTITTICDEYRTSLERMNLIAGKAVYDARKSTYYSAFFILALIAGAKIYIAIQLGKQNFLFLLILAFIFYIYLTRSTKTR